MIQQQSSKKAHRLLEIAVSSTSRQPVIFAATDCRAKGLPCRIDVELTRHGHVSDMIRALTFRTRAARAHRWPRHFGLDLEIVPSLERKMHQRVRFNSVAPARTFTVPRCTIPRVNA
jgi:hypothetical protein